MNAGIAIILHLYFYTLSVNNHDEALSKCARHESRRRLSHSSRVRSYQTMTRECWDHSATTLACSSSRVCIVLGLRERGARSRILGAGGASVSCALVLMAAVAPAHPRIGMLRSSVPNWSSGMGIASNAKLTIVTNASLAMPLPAKALFMAMPPCASTMGRSGPGRCS